MQILTALIAGLVFGIGLIVAGMTNPAKVQGFLDLAGNWDPSLAFVMGGAILVGVAGFRFAGQRERSLLGEAMRLPTSTVIDRRLVLGGLAFGAGWGLAGFCPGPALAVPSPVLCRSRKCASAVRTRPRPWVSLRLRTGPGMRAL